MPTLGQQYQFVESQATYIEPRMRMIMHGSIQYPTLAGISREANPHADSITYYSYNFTGEMVNLSNRGNDIPLVQTQLAQHIVNIEWLALGYDWSDREIGRAMMLGQSLSDRKVRAAFRTAEEEKERIFLNGNANYGWDGLINHSTIPKTTAAKTWATSTDKEIFNDANNLIANRWSATNQVRLCDTLLLPVSQFTLLSRPMGDNANQSVMQYLKMYNPYTAATGRELMIKTLRQLDGAGPSNADRALAYPRDMEVLRYHIPQELTFIEPQRRGFSWVYHGSMVLAGLEIMEPTAMAYLDGI